MAAHGPPHEQPEPDEHALSDRVWQVLVDPDEEDLADVPDALIDALPGNGVRQIMAMTLQKVGDVVVDAKTVLPWLLTQFGAPAGALAMLVPVRESGSLLPQTSLLRFVQARPRRKWVWVAGACGQACAVAGMALLAIVGDGRVAAWSIVGLLGLFALARALSSIASKDVMGRTVPKGLRGRISGAATMASGFVALTLGVALQISGAELTGTTTIAGMLVAAAIAWVLAAVVYASVVEPDDEHGGGRGSDGHVDAGGDRRHDDPTQAVEIGALRLLRTDEVFRRFVLARALLLVSALSPPFVVALATRHGAGDLTELGAFVVAAGIASLVGGRIWGRRADRSSRTTMALAAVLGSTVIVGLLVAMRLPAMREFVWLYPATHFLLSLIHTGSRIGRKTYLVDFAQGDDRTRRVAVSNTAIGVVLLVVGALTTVAAAGGEQMALGLLAIMGLAGAVVSRRLPEVSRPTSAAS